MVSEAVRLELQQKGPKVTGYVRGIGVGSRSTTIEGSIAGDVFKFSNERGTLTGELTVNGDEMRGQGSWVAIGSRSVTFNLRRVDAATSPSAPPR
jgi:hypothetical protein